MEKERVSNYDPNKKNYIRQHDPEHVSRNRKQASKNAHFNGYDDEVIRGGKRARAKKPSAQQMMAPIKIETAYMAGDTITVRDLTEKIGKSASEIIKKLFLLGNMATLSWSAPTLRLHSNANRNRQPKLPWLLKTLTTLKKICSPVLRWLPSWVTLTMVRPACWTTSARAV